MTLDQFKDLPASQKNLQMADLVRGETFRRLAAFVNGELVTFLGCVNPPDHITPEGVQSHIRSDGWKSFLKNPSVIAFPFKDVPSPEQITVKWEIWAMRYSDTPGGAWNIIEHLEKLGYKLQLANVDGGWMAIAVDTMGVATRDTTPTMPQAVCNVAFQLLTALVHVS